MLDGGKVEVLSTLSLILQVATETRPLLGRERGRDDPTEPTRSMEAAGPTGRAHSTRKVKVNSYQVEVRVLKNQELLQTCRKTESAKSQIAASSLQIQS